MGRSRDQATATIERALAAERAASAATEARLSGELDRLREGHAALDARHSREIDALGERLRHAEEAAAALAARLERVERDYEGVLPTITRALVQRLELEHQAAGADDLPTTLLRLDRELKAQREETDKVARALFERMELLRPRADAR